MKVAKKEINARKHFGIHNWELSMPQPNYCGNIVFDMKALVHLHYLHYLNGIFNIFYNYVEKFLEGYSKDVVTVKNN